MMILISLKVGNNRGNLMFVICKFNNHSNMKNICLKIGKDSKKQIISNFSFTFLKII